MLVQNQNYYDNLAEKAKIISETIKLIERHNYFAKHGEEEEKFQNGRAVITLESKRDFNGLGGLLGNHITDEEAVKMREYAYTLLKERLKKLQTDLKFEFSS